MTTHYNTGTPCCFSHVYRIQLKFVIYYLFFHSRYSFSALLRRKFRLNLITIRYDFIRDRLKKTYYRIIVKSELKKYSLSWKYKGNVIFLRERGAVRDPITCVLQEKRFFYPRYIRVIDVRLLNTGFLLFNHSF